MKFKTTLNDIRMKIHIGLALHTLSNYKTLFKVYEKFGHNTIL